MALVFTVFFCGTGSNSFDVHNSNYPMGEIVSTLASNHSGVEFAHWILVDGPGSGNYQEDEKWDTPGNYSDTRGKLEGAGWEENVAHALAVIKGNPNWQRKVMTDKEYQKLKEANIPISDKTLVSKGWIYNTYENPQRKVTQQQLQYQKAAIFRKAKKVSAVNIVGWSRGGVSSIMLANALYNDSETREIPVRIFAVDPVPGLGNFQAHRCALAENVKEYVGVYARDECSKGFAPIIPAFADMVKKPAIIPFPGRHATLPGNGANDGESGTQEADFLSVGKLVRHLAEQCLEQWGATLGNKLGLTSDEVAEQYRTMVSCDGRLSALKNKSYTYFRDMTDGERTVGWGEEGAGAKFSAVTGSSFSNEQGLSLGLSGGTWLQAYNRELQR